MPVNKERVRLLVDDLKNGNHKQGEEVLACTNPDGTISYCCLGRACEVAIASGAGVSKKKSGYVFLYDGNAKTLPQSVMDWYGFNDEDPLIGDGDTRSVSAATHYNDFIQLEFPEIGELFEKTYLTEDSSVSK